MKKIALFEHPLATTPIVELSEDYAGNHLYVKRDDMVPFCFGGNKARKAAEFYKEIQKANADVVMTYGSNSSNHCRIIANMAAAMGLSCHIISPAENREQLYNTKLVEQFGAVVETCPVTEVATTIANRIKAYEEEGRRPYFITGGGHGNPGTESYVKAYREIMCWQRETGVQFDYIFHASGTGTTQAGLVCGQLLMREQSLQEEKQPQIIGISIAREEARGREVVKDSIREYLGEKFETLFTEEALCFTDAYRLGGYGEYDSQITDTIAYVMAREGIPMDTTYVGKAFTGMLQYLKEYSILHKNILFIHTGGAPLYFDKL